MTIATVPTTVPDLLGTAPADLIDGTDFPVASRDVAVRRAERIRAGVASYAAMRQDIADAYAQHDWEALDYPSWHAYLEGEFGEELRALKRDERPAAVQDLRSQGMSTRQIAAAVGTDARTVRRDLDQVGHSAPPAKVTGSDGKTYAASRPETPARRDPESTPDPAVATPGGPGATPEPERPKPAAWDPAERAAHEADVKQRRDIEIAHRSADAIVRDLELHVINITVAYRYGEKDLITRDTIAKLRAAIDRLEAEL